MSMQTYEIDAKAPVLCGGLFTPVVHQPMRTTANKHESFLTQIPDFAGIFEQQRTIAT
jgi:hypothetical protein